MPIMTKGNVLLMKKLLLWCIRVHTCRFKSINNNWSYFLKCETNVVLKKCPFLRHESIQMKTHILKINIVKSGNIQKIGKNSLLLHFFIPSVCINMLSFILFLHFSQQRQVCFIIDPYAFSTEHNGVPGNNQNFEALR